MGVEKALAIAVLALGAFPAGAQGYLTNACQTQFGVCGVPAAPAGAPCMCAPGGPLHAGRMVLIAPPPVQAPALMQQRPMSIACRTRRGICQLPFAGPVGAACGCGFDPGQIIMMVK